MTKSIDELYRWYDQLGSDEEYHIFTIKADFAAELERLMNERSVTKEDIAKAIGKSQGYITRILNCNANLTIDNMVKIAMYFDCVYKGYITKVE